MSNRHAAMHKLVLSRLASTSLFVLQSEKIVEFALGEGAHFSLGISQRRVHFSAGLSHCCDLHTIIFPCFHFLAYHSLTAKTYHDLKIPSVFIIQGVVADVETHLFIQACITSLCLFTVLAWKIPSRTQSNFILPMCHRVIISKLPPSALRIQGSELRTFPRSCEEWRLLQSQYHMSNM